jgi:MFS family permease
MTAAAAHLVAPSETQYRKAITAGVIGNVLEWYDFGVYGYLVPTISQLFFPSGDPTVSLLSTFAVFGVGFVMRPVGSILFGIYGDPPRPPQSALRRHFRDGVGDFCNGFATHLCAGRRACRRF